MSGDWFFATADWTIYGECSKCHRLLYAPEGAGWGRPLACQEHGVVKHFMEDFTKPVVYESLTTLS